MVVEFGMKRNVLFLTASNEDGQQMIDDGGTTTKGGVTESDIKGITDINIWDDKW